MAFRFCCLIALVAGTTFLSESLSAQNAATLIDLGANAPTPGANDISQLSTSGEASSPDGLNYYTDNYPSHGGGAPGQTFTTGTNAAGYWLNTVTFKTGGGGSESTTTAQTYIMDIFTVSNTTATTYADYVASNFAFNDGDWLEWSGFSLLLAPNTTYAYCFSRTSSGTGWEQLANASNNPYAGGQIALLPVGGGAITYGASGQFDGVFDLGLTLTPSGPPVLNLSTNWGVWQGWGCSLCWWANVFGTRTDLADIVFTTNYTTLNGVNLPGLGMNIARYNAGACSTNSVNGQFMVASPNIPDWKQMPGYWLNPSSSNPATTNWNWNADTNQRAMMLMAQARGASIQLFSNSPMWWMLDNFNPSGPNTASTDNLQPAYDDAHAVYLATIAAYAQTNWGVTFNSIEAFNEPHGSYWISTGTQEGCYFDTPLQETVIGYLRTEMNNRGLTNMPIAASDETSFDVALSTWQGFNSTVQGNVGIVTSHDYAYDSGSGLYAAVGGKTLWNTEYGEADGTGLTLATNMVLTLSTLHPTAWCYWQPLDQGGWGLIQSDVGSSNITTPNPKYYVLAQYTRHIRPGMTILDSLVPNTVAAYSVTNRTLVLVTCNLGAAQTIGFCLTNVPYAAGPVTRWITVPNTTTNYVQYSDVSITSNFFQVAFPPNSIQTFQIANVDLNPPSPPAALSASAGSGIVYLNWTPSIGTTNYVLERATNSTGPYSLLSSVLATNYTDTQVTNGVTYYYTVTAVNGAGPGAMSTPASATPYGHPIIIATTSSGQISLSWPGWASNYSVYYTTNLNPPIIWLPLTNQAQSTNGNLGIVLPTTNGAAGFYRLGTN